MTARCHFVIAAALISQARTEDEVDERLQRYLEVRYHISVFDTFFTDHVRNNPKSGIYPDLLVKMSTLFVFDFESAVCLKQWDDSSEIVRKATICKDEIMYKAMADCLLRSEAPGNGTWQLIFDSVAKKANSSSCVWNNASHYQRNIFTGRFRQRTAGKVYTLLVQGYSASGRSSGFAGHRTSSQGRTRRKPS